MIVCDWCGFVREAPQAEDIYCKECEAEFCSEMCLSQHESSNCEPAKSSPEGQQ